MERPVIAEQSQQLRKAIENLMNAKLYDALARPDGLARLAGHRSTGVASPEIRHAERELDGVLNQIAENIASVLEARPPLVSAGSKVLKN
jgi:hypothetical protein